MTRPRRATIADLPSLSVTKWVVTPPSRPYGVTLSLGSWSLSVEKETDLTGAQRLRDEVFLPLYALARAAGPTTVVLSGGRRGKVWVVGVYEGIRSSGSYSVSARLVGTGPLRRKRA